MARNEQADSRTTGARGFSRWMQLKANARTMTRIRRGRGTSMGMNLLILHTVGRRSGQPRQSPLAWFPDGESSWLVIASGGGDHNPAWFANMMANPDAVSVELPGKDAVAVTVQRLDGADRAPAWQRILAAQPRFEKYQRKSVREYPVVRLVAK